MKKRIYIFLAIAGLLAVFISVFLSKKETRAFSEVKRGTIVNSIYGIGTLTVQRSQQIKSGVTTRINRFYVKEGDVVKRNQKLVELDGVGTFSANFSGVVTSLVLKEGETVFAQTAIMTIADYSDAYLSVAVEQLGALRIKPGLPVRVNFDGMREKTFDGRVESIYSNGSEFLSRISLTHLPENVLPGMTADVAIVVEEKKDALIVPVSALYKDYVIVASGNREKKVPVKIGLVEGAYVEVITTELQGGEKLLINMDAKL